MKIEVTTKIGDVVYKYHIEESNDLESLHKAIVLGNPPNYCPLCKNDNWFEMTSNKDKDANIYVSIRCKKCNAKSKLGLYKAGGYFWHQYEKYEKKSNAEQAADKVVKPIEETTNNDDLPF